MPPDSSSEITKKIETPLVNLMSEVESVVSCRPTPPLSTGTRSIHSRVSEFCCLASNVSLSRLMGTVFGPFSAFDRGVGKDLLFIVDRGLLVFTQSHVDLFTQASLSFNCDATWQNVFFAKGKLLPRR